MYIVYCIFKVVYFLKLILIINLYKINLKMIKHNSKISDLLLHTNFIHKKNNKSKPTQDIINSLIQSTSKHYQLNKSKIRATQSPNVFDSIKHKNEFIKNKKIYFTKVNSKNKSIDHSRSITFCNPNVIKSKSKVQLNIKFDAVQKPNTNEKKTKNKTITVSRSNSISNLDQTTTIASSNSIRKNQTNNGTSIYNLKLKKFLANNNSEKKNPNDYNKQILHTQADELNENINHFFNYNDSTLKTGENICKSKLNLNLLKKNQDCFKNLKQKIQDNIFKRKQIVDELLSEDSVFDYSKNNSISITNNNSKEKNKSIPSRNNESELQTLSLTYSDDEGSVEKSKQKNKYYYGKRAQRNISLAGNHLFKDSDFLTFCEEMNQKLFNGK